jgi:hypothetical protein
MSKKMLVNGAWVLLAGVAFLFGRKSGAESDDVTEGGLGDRGMVSRRVSRGGEGSGVNERARVGGTVKLGENMIAGALEKVVRERDPLRRQKAFCDLLESITAENVEAMVRAHHDAPGERWDKWQEQRLLVYAWGKLDGEAALTYGNELDDRMKELIVNTALSGWATEDPEGAKGWLAGLEDADERREFSEGLIIGLLQGDVAAATDYMMGLPAREQDRDQMKIILRHQLRVGLGVARSWADNLPEGMIKGAAMRELAEGLVDSDVEAAAAWAGKYVHAEYGSEVVAKVAEEWAENKPEEALAWVMTLEDSDARNRAMRDSLREWSRKDLDAAGEFLAGLEAGAMRDSAASQYARDVVKENPATAMEWAQSIGDEGIRMESVVGTARHWLQRDEDAAREWLANAGLSPEVVEQINK